MAKSKYESVVLPNLENIRRWAEEGATKKEIAKRLRLSVSAFKGYLKKAQEGDERYEPLLIAFTQGNAVANDAVEAALYKRACGYEYEETVIEEKWVKDLGQIMKMTKVFHKQMPPDPTSAMFWLTNMAPEKWQYRPEGKEQEPEDGIGVVLLPNLLPQEGEKGNE